MANESVGSVRSWRGARALVGLVSLVWWGGLPGCSDGDAASVPLAQDSPWPKFRGNERQTGATAMVPTAGGALWEFPTGKGIFSSPVIGADGTVYVGSADRSFYAIAPDGSLRWSFETGEIIDSAALLDDEGRVVFGSGDGHVYALDAADGSELWRFAADPPDTNNAFINWFEGNVAIGPNGDLYAPNDNFFVYALDRQTGEARWRATMRDQTWSSPAVDPSTGQIYIGNNNLLPALGDNIFSFDADGKQQWSNTVIGSVAASPLLTGDGAIVVGGFDGYVRAYSTDIGLELWSFGTRDHVYASPAQAPDGTIVQPSADGTVYGLDPDTGAQRWAFDASEAIRSSPAIDGNGVIYFGSGEGRLFALDPDGSLRWAIRLIDDDRNDLNSSPALGRDAIYVAGENGSIFSVPYDYCLEESDSRCTVGGEALPDDGAFVQYTTAFGAPLTEPPASIDARQPLAFSLFVREGGDTMLALIDSESVDVAVTPEAPIQVEVSGDRRFLTVVPLEPLSAGDGGTVSIRVSGDYLSGFERQGLQFLGGDKAGSYDQTFTFALTDAGPGELPLPVPAEPGDPAGVWELYRLAAPLPAMLPSYNQIGFDSLHYLIGVVEPGVAWVVGGILAEEGGRTLVDPATGVLFPIELDYTGGDLTLVNESGFALEVMGFALELDTFRVAARLDASGDAPAGATVVVSAICRDIPLYGAFVRELGLCNPQTDVLQVFGGTLLRAHEGGVQQPPAGLGDVSFELTAEAVYARLDGSELRAGEHALAVLLIDGETGRPIKRDYGKRTTVTADAQGRVTEVSITLGTVVPPATMRAYLMVDTYPAARATLTPSPSP